MMWLWWFFSTAWGFAMGLAVAVGSTPREHLEVEYILQCSLMGLVLGAVGGYVMAWLAPVLPNWMLRVLAAALVGSVLSAFPGPGMGQEAARIMCPVGGTAGLMTALFVWRLSLLPP